MSGATQVSGQRSVVPGKFGGTLTPWQKGQSGNPGGRNLQKYGEVRRMAADNSLPAMKRLIELMSGDDERVAYMACMAILERGIGKPRDHSNEEQAMAGMDLSKLSLADQEQLASMLRRMLGMAGKPAVDVTPEPASEPSNEVTSENTSCRTE